MILDSQTKVIRAYLGGAITTLPVDYNVAYADHDLVTHNFEPGHSFGTISGSTPVTLISEPAFHIQRQAKLIAIYNSDSANVTVTVDVYDGTNARIWYKAFLEPGWSAQWEPGGTWHVYDENGILLPLPTGGGGGTFEAGVSTGGNTVGTTGTVSNRLILAGGNNITLSGSTDGAGMTVTISGGGGGGGGVAVSAAGNSISTGTAVWSNANNVSFGMAGSTITASASFLQSNQTLGIYGSSQTTGQSSSSTYDARSLSIVGQGIVSVGWSNSSLLVSATQSNQAFSAGAAQSNFQTLVFQDSNGVSFSNNAGSIRVTHDLQFTSNTSNITSNALHSTAVRVFHILAATNNTGGGTASLSSNVSFSAANGATFYTSAGNAIALSYTVPSQSNQQMTFFGTGNTTQSSSGTMNASSIILRGSNIVSVGVSNGSLIFDATTPAQSNQQMTLFATGNTTQSSSGTMNASSIIFRGSNNASVGISNGSVIVDVTVPGGAGGVAASAAGNSVSNGTVVWSNSNNVSFGMAGSTITATATFAESNQTIGFYAVGNTTQNSSTTLDARTVSFGGRGDITVGYSNGTIQISGTQTNQQMTMFATGNTTLSSSGTSNASSLIFRGSNLVSVGITNGSVLIDATSAAQTNQSMNWFAVGNTTQNSSTTMDARTISVGGRGDISVGYSAGTLQISGSQSNQVLSMYAQSNTTLSSSGTQNASTLMFAGAGIASVGVSNGSVVVSVPSGGGAGDGVNIVMVSTGGHTAGNTGSSSTGTIVLEGTSSLTLSQITGGAGVHTIRFIPAMSQLTAGANISLSTNGSTISIIGLSPTLSLYATGNTTLSSSGTINASSIIIRGSNNVSIGISNGSIIVDAAGGGGGFTAPGYHPYDDFVQVTGQHGNGSLIIDPQVMPNVTCDRFQVYIHNTNSSNSSGSHSLTFRVGLYTRNVSTLSLYTSWSGTTALTHSGTAGSYSWYSGYRQLPITFAATLITEGRYWIGFVSSTSSAGANGSYSNFVVSNINSQYTGLFGTASNASMQHKLGQGYYSAATNGLPNSIAFSDIRGTNSMARRMAVIGFGSATA